MNEQKITWNAGKITILAGSIVAFLAMFLPWFVEVNERSLGKQDLGVLGNVSLGSVSVRETMNGWGHVTTEMGMLSKSHWEAAVGIPFILGLVLLLVPIFCVITKREKSLKSKLIFAFPILPCLFSLTSASGGGIGGILFLLSTIAITAGIVIFRRNLSIGPILEKFKGENNA